ncbi:TetR/AcrR family transcriptional regulator [Pseudorhodoferax sp. LjRoot39]|uniref:TetR/AcrR family transcriptional regulator n=1 Tax=Pseudorhodoferax sp. LjRoot39 TaxID=3342328 RepID=UPI003ED0A83F
MTIKTNTPTPARPPSAVRPRARAGRDSKELLLGIAAKMFRDKGYAGTSIRDIVKKARIEPSALYYHYASKEALLDAVLERSIQAVHDEVRRAVEQLPANASPRERITAAIATHLRAIGVHGDFALASRRVIGEVPAAVRRKHDAMRATYGTYWQSLFDDAAAHGEFGQDTPRGLARMFLMGALNWSSEWYDARKKTPQQLAVIFSRMLFDGMGQPASAPPARTRAARVG